MTCPLAGVLLLLIFTGTGDARDYRVRKKAGELTFDIRMNRNPPVLGGNEIRISISDPQGKRVGGMVVLVNYYMPPMAGMPPMNYTIPANPEGDEYRAVMDFIMTGPWNIVVRSKHQGKFLKVVIPIDVR